MTFRRLSAIALIFLGTSLAWAVLGSSLVARSGEFDGRLEREVQLLWGRPHRQTAPNAWILRPSTDTVREETKDQQGRTLRKQVSKTVLRPIPVVLESTRATADLDLEHRRKGLLWYSTYTVTFKGSFTFRNPDGEMRALHVRLPLPAEDALFDDFVFTVDGRTAVPAGDVSKEMTAVVNAEPGAVVTLDVQYRSRGLGTWTYAFAGTGVAQVRDFNLTLRTNFRDIDFPAGTVSPNEMTSTPNGWALVWTFRNLISGQAIGMELPEKLNPGPFAARVTFFAPVSLLFFLAVMVMVGTTAGTPLHPMHYWFISAAFFAFHLLLAYLVDHVSVHVAFATAAVVSMLLVFSYLRVVTGMRRALLAAGSAQLLFLVLFSYAFFFEGFTGLAITVGAILTLFVLMQMTARVSWDEVFIESRG
ncbi:MAG TPA: inner membrane CreD family protein [Vicinamibacterales bacterium]|nr:inner membrane CreD family protein [Vicinamibacterales bacterium]